MAKKIKTEEHREKGESNRAETKYTKTKDRKTERNMKGERK